MATEYVVDYVGHGVIEYGDDQQSRSTRSGLLHISLGEHCNERARDGWRLVSVIGSTAGPLLFFEREAKIPSQTEDDVAHKMATQFAQASAATR